MPKKRFSAKQIVTLLRQIEVSMAQGNAAPVACRHIAAELRDKLPNGEIFYSLKEAYLLFLEDLLTSRDIRPIRI